MKIEYEEFENVGDLFLYSFVDMSNSYIPDFKSSFIQDQI